MSNDGGPAFPYHDTHNGILFTQPGMTLRDYFAAKAMMGLVQTENVTWKKGQLSKRSYEISDAMLAQRKVGND